MTLLITGIDKRLAELAIERLQARYHDQIWSVVALSPGPHWRAQGKTLEAAIKALIALLPANSSQR